MFTREIDLYYEHFLDANKSIETCIGLILPMNTGIDNYKTIRSCTYFPELFYYTGVMLTTQYRLYNKKGMYLSPLLKYKYMFFDNKAIQKNTGEGMYTYYSMLEDSKKQTYTIELLFGIQKKYFLNIDFYTGFGIRYIYTDTDVIEIYGSGPLREPGRFTHSYIVPTFHLGIKLGFDFKRK